jgi:hypothetical protein
MSLLSIHVHKELRLVPIQAKSIRLEGGEAWEE